MSGEDDSDDARSAAALVAFECIQRRRKCHLAALASNSGSGSDTGGEQHRSCRGDGSDDSDDDSAVAAPRSRLFVLSDTEEPWRVFTTAVPASSLQQRLQRQRLVYEWSSTHMSALHTACAAGDRKIVHALLERSHACTLARDASGRIPLHHAAVCEQHKVVRLLLQRHDASLQARVRDNACCTSAHYVLEKLAVLAHHQCHLRVIEATAVAMRCQSTRYRRLWRTADRLLLATRIHAATQLHSSSDDNNLDASLIALDLRCRGDAWNAARSGDLERLQFLVRVDFWGESSTSNARTIPGINAATSQRLPMLQHLQWTLLHEACDYQRVPIVCFLATHLLARLDIQDTSGCTPLHYAAMRSCLDACVVLLDASSSSATDASSDALCLAVDVRGRTPLHSCLLVTTTANSNMNVAPVASFLAYTCVAALHVRDADGYTPLHLAIARGDLALVHLLIDLGANVNSLSSSDPMTTVNTASNKTTATWAPCGVRFQATASAVQKKRKKTTRVERSQVQQTSVQRPPGDATDPPIDAVRPPAPAPTPIQTDVNRSDATSTNNPNTSARFDANNDADVLSTLRYWIRTPIAHKKTEDGDDTEQPTVSVTVLRADGSGDIVGDELLGCSKYGGQCRLCACDTDTVDVEDGTRRHPDALSPLVVAIRCCRRRSRSASDRDRTQRLHIVECLLVAGADPNGSDAHSQPLDEALVVALECPPVLTVLLAHGATHITTTAIERFCRSMLSSLLANNNDAHRFDRTPTVDNVVVQLLQSITLTAATTMAERTTLAVVLFATGCFDALHELIDAQHAMVRRHSDSDSDACLWCALADRLASFAEPLRMRALVQRLDCNHLSFVCDAMEQHERLPMRRHRCKQSHAQALRVLLCICLTRCLTMWHQASKRCILRECDFEERQRILSTCFERLAIASCELHGDDDSELTRWIEDCIALQLFDAALLLINKQLQSPNTSISIDRVLQVFDDDVVSSRHNNVVVSGTDDSELAPAHRAFLLAFLSSAITQQTPLVDDATQDDDNSNRCDVHATVAASSASVVRVVAHNVPLEIVTRVLAIAARNTTEDSSNSSSSHCIRVRTKTLAEWLVYHNRRDLMDHMLDAAQPTDSMLRLWHTLVSAAACVRVGLCATWRTMRTELLDWLVSKRLTVRCALPATMSSVHSSSVEASDVHSTLPEDEELTWLLRTCAVRCNSVPLFRLVMQRLWPATQSHDDGEGEGVVDLPPQSQTPQQKQMLEALVAIDFFHAVVRCNALKLAAHVLQACASASNDTWRAALSRPPRFDTTGEDSSTRLDPLALCYALGRVELAELLLTACAGTADPANATISNELPRSSEDDGDATASFRLSLPSTTSHGLFASIMRLNALANTSLSLPRADANNTALFSRHPRAARVLIDDSSVFAATRCWWHTACALGLPKHLDALRLHRVPPVGSYDDDGSDAAEPPSAWSRLLHVAVAHGALNALRWLLTVDNAADTSAASSSQPLVMCFASHAMSDAQALALYEAASKHTSDLFAHMTLLLLTHGVRYPGRLAGDGTDTTLLHRVVCFTNVRLMQQTLDCVLALPHSSIDVLDSRGNAPVVYAFASGHLANVCALVRSHRARLEAEYEGQSQFYYTLQLAPSFAWRFVLATLLRVACGRRLLHCAGDNSDSDIVADDEAESEQQQQQLASLSTCGCKGFESVSNTVAATAATMPVESEVCGFCGHDAARHWKVPFPPWFVDQYETYVRSSRTKSHDTADDSDNDGSDDSHINARKRQQQLASATIDEVVLEDERGRLDVAALTALTKHRFASLIKQHGLTEPSHRSSSNDAAQVLLTKKRSVSPDTEAVLTDCVNCASAAWTMFPLQCLDGNDSAVVQKPRMQSQSTTDVAGECDTELAEDGTALCASDDTATNMPWHLRADMLAMHPLSCRCQRREFATSEAAWIFQVVSQWLSCTAQRYCQTAVAPVRNLSDRPTLSWSLPLTPLHAIASPKWAVRLAFVCWRQHAAVLAAFDRSERALACSSSSATTLTTATHTSVRRLQQFISHWRFARVFAAFQRWKHAQVSVGVHQLQLATTLHAITSQMQQSRLAALQSKQQQLLAHVHQVERGTALDDRVERRVH